VDLPRFDGHLTEPSLRAKEVTMATHRRQFSREFKLEAVRLMNAGQTPLKELARELGVRSDTLRSWQEQAGGRIGMKAGDVFPGNGKRTTQEEELAALRRELEQVKAERDFLKKAAAYFAKESR
jgi:transposase-like protein